MPWVCTAIGKRAYSHYYEDGAALCGRVANVEDAKGTEKPPAYACGSCKQKLRIRERGVK